MKLTDTKKCFCWKMVLPIIALVNLVLAGCIGGTSKPSRFYTLNPVKPAVVDGMDGSAQAGTPEASIGILPVEIPDYLDRSEIVTRTKTNELQLSDFDRWGGDLRSDIARVLAETLSGQYPEKRVAIITGRRILPAEYRVAVNVTRFDAIPGENVWLQAHWSVIGEHGDVLARRDSNLNVPLRGRDYPSIVAAMSDAVDRLGNQIAGVLKPLLAKASAEKENSGQVASGD